MALLLSIPAAAQDRASATGAANAAVVAPLTVRAIDPLLFGTLAVGQAQGGTITVDPGSGGITFTGILRGLCPSTAGCLAQPALFGVFGEAGRRYRITAPGETLAQPVSGGGPGLRVTQIALAVQSQPGSAQQGLLDASGQDRFRLGGTLEVAPGTAAGIYRADVEVVVAYD